ncbi:Ail/Lom family outer membrane beta-barrel protein, partial [Escherichia coli]|uniref:Ail/Lom family outer membrane beta-barrel protein n=1 Tax=Escherichia coli TaxID=562 RepID=UPI0029F5CB93
MLIDLVLPYPPTVNTYWRRRGSTYFISEEGKRYRRAVALIVRQQRLKLSLSGRLDEDSVRNRWFSVMAGPSVRVNEWFSAYAMVGVAYSRVSTFSGDYLRVTDNKGKTH